MQGTQATITDSSGSYFISNLPPGTYQLVVYYADAQFQRTNVLIQLGQTAGVNVAINTKAAAGETIVIQGRAPLIDQSVDQARQHHHRGLHQQRPHRPHLRRGAGRGRRHPG